jgi:hypothetical protein
MRRWNAPIRAGLAGLAAALALSLTASAAGQPGLYYLGPAKVFRVGVDGRGLKTLVDGPAGGLNDGIAIDEARGHIYWTNMGRASADDGTITRSDLDGGNVKVIVPAGGTFTPKQLKIDTKNGKLYWSDREGMRVMRAGLDGSNIETLVVTGTTDAERREQSRWCVGIAVDVARGKVYWTQKGGDNAGQGTIKRANLNIPRGQTAANRTDIEVLFSGLPEPIDLDLDLGRRQIYWTDRGDNTVSRAPMNPPRGADPANRKDREVLVRGLREAIGVYLDLPNRRMFYTSLGGEVGTAGLDGSGAKLLLTNQGTLTGIAMAGK